MDESIIEFLKIHGERLDADIAQALKMPMSRLKRSVSELTSAGEIVCCRVTRFDGGRKIEGMSYRLANSSPPPSPGRKRGPKRAPDADGKSS
jgi:hypothetical protein